MHLFYPSKASRLSRLLLLALAFIINALLGNTPVTRADDKLEIHVGYQRGGVWSVLKVQQLLEARFGANVTTTWTLFPAGPQLLEALNAGAIDIGSTGETPPIFAQAAGTPLVYVAYQSSSGAGQAVLVPENSPIKTVADLKGKKIAFNKASSAHLLLVRTLEKYGLSYNDVEPVFLAPPEARAAFQGGSVDAWVIWNPFLEAAKQELNAQVLVDGADIGNTKGFTLASRAFVEAHPDIVTGIIDELQKAQDWAYANKDAYAELQAKETGLDASVWKSTFLTEAPRQLFIDETAIVDQQKTADIFFDLKLIPEKLTIRDAVWIGGENPQVAATAEATAEATPSK